MDDAKEKPAGVVAYLGVRENPAGCICQSQAPNSAFLSLNVVNVKGRNLIHVIVEPVVEKKICG